MQRAFPLTFHILFGQGLYDLCRTAQQHRPGRGICFSGDQSAGAYQTPLPQHSVIQNNSAHTDETAVANGAAVEDRAVTHGTIFSDFGFLMDNAVVLNVCAHL